MITVDQILETARRRRSGPDDSSHRHDLETQEFNVEGFRVRGKVCKKCGERFFLVEDLAQLEEALAARGGTFSVTAQDALLLLAGTYPHVEVPGSLVLQKEMFLLEKSFAPEYGIRIEPLLFRPYHMGPFSEKVKHLVETLVKEGVLEKRELAARAGVSYQLTEKGRKRAESARKKVPQTVYDQLRKRRRAWDELGSYGLLRLVYEDFSAYAARSRIKDRVGEDRAHAD